MEMVEERIKRQIVAKARQNPNGSFSDDFIRSYDMTGIVFSIGDTTIGGRFSGSATEESGVLTISGTLEFHLRDKFADPLDIGVEAIDLGETIFENIHRPLDDYLRGRTSRPQRLGIHTGEPYAITDKWSGRFEGQVYADPERSAYR